MGPKKLVDETVDIYSPMQVYQELVMLTTFLSSRTLINVLEIGSHRCGMLYILSKIASGEVISVDLCNPSAEGYQKVFKTLNPHVKLLRGNSHDELMKKSVVQILDGKKLDLLLIDGDHSTVGILNDVDMYSPLVAQGGIIVLHDIDHRHALLTEPANAWNILKADSRFEKAEIIYLGSTPDIDYTNKAKLSQITDLLYFSPQLFHERFPTLKGLPPRLGGFGILYRH